MSNINDEFALAATQFAKEEEDAKNRRASGNTGGTYEQIKWTGLEKQQMKIIRALGGVPDKDGRAPTDAKSIQLAWVKGDDGKNFRSILPLRTADPDHIMWRIISKVKESAYINKKKVFVNEVKHEDIFKMIAYNSVPADQQRFNRGWEGKHVLIMNVLDREQMDWHKENNHTMLLSRAIGMSKDGTREFPEEGVPMYGLYSQILNNCFSNYGDWNNYDLGITRTGELTMPYKVCNATAYKLGNIPEIPQSLVPFISTTPLSEEEKAYERYDLDKLFQQTSYTKYYNKLKASVAMIDARLGTNFLDELKYEAEKEKAEREANAAANGEASPAAPQDEFTATAYTASVETPVTPVAPVTPAPIVEQTAPISAPVVEPVVEPATRVAEAAPAVRAPAPAAVANLDKVPFLYKLPTEQQATITSVTLNAQGALESITSSDPSAMVSCPSCRLVSPEAYVACIGCGQDFV